MESKERAAIRHGLDALKPYLASFVAQGARMAARGGNTDTQALLKTVLDEWDTSFRRVMPHVARSYVHELLDVRNRWAHEAAFSRAEADRALDTMRQLAAMIGAPTARGNQHEPSNAPVRTEPRASIQRPGLAKKWPSQRDTMRGIYARSKHDHERVIREYAIAEQSGVVRRKANKSGLSPVEYARALFADGMKKGWLG